MRFFFALLLIGLFAALGRAPARAWPGAPEPVPVQALPGWRQEHVADAIEPLRRACAKLDRRWRSVCADLRYVPAGDETAARSFVERDFRAFPLGTGLYTGYFELDVPGSRVRGGPYQVPVLSRPADPTRYARSAIEHGALAGQGLEIVWLTSASDLYFLQLQGSGRIRLPDGGIMRLGYAANNGHAPVPTDALFRNAGIPGNDLSIPGIRAWIARHPAAGLARLSQDPSFVFFHETTGASLADGHVGALGAPLVPMRSIAVDPAYVPLGSPVWLDTIDSSSGQRLQRLMLAGDTGDQIQGPARADIFYGWDHRAEAQGGHEYARGRSWVLRPTGEPRLAARGADDGPS